MQLRVRDDKARSRARGREFVGDEGMQREAGKWVDGHLRGLNRQIKLLRMKELLV